MSKNKRSGNQVRAAPEKDSSTVAFMMSADNFDVFRIPGYTRLADNPEVVMAATRIADLIGTMTLHLMQNTDVGDVRVKNGLSRKLDIEPNHDMTRIAFFSVLVRTMLLEGQGNAAVFPEIKDGLIDNLVPLEPSKTSFLQDGRSYRVVYQGQDYQPNEVLHFTLNPDPEYPWRGMGVRVILKDVVHNLKQAAATKKGFMESKWKPSLIVRVDSNAEELATPAGRDKLLEQYVDVDSAGKPWVLPADSIEVQQVKPLTLNDLALNNSVTLDKKTVAGIFKVPPFVVGAGDFDKDEWNNFINATIFPIARGIEQELTRKLLIASDLYFRFNVRSLYNYSLEEIVKAGSEMVDRMAMRRNEWRDWVGLPPDEEMTELLALENYIPASRLGDQKKLNGEDNSAGTSSDENLPVDGVAKVAEVSLNGAQIQSLLSIVQAVTAQELQYASAVTLITSAFPFDEATAKEILGDSSKLKPDGGEE